MLWGVPMGAARGRIGVLVVMVRREDKAMRSGVGRCIVREVCWDGRGHGVEVD